jgi:TolB protein
MRLRVWIVAAILLAWVAGVNAQVRVVKGAGEKSSIDWSGFNAAGDAGAQTFLKTMTDDLVRSGWFKRGAPGATEFALTGSVTGSGALQVQAIVYGRVAARQVFGKSYSGEPAAARRLAHQVADEIIEAITGRKGLASARMAVVGTRSGKKELYLCDADGQGLTQLTRDNSISISPNWSPDGRQLIYTSFMKGFADVYLVELASGGRRRVAGFAGLNTGASISPNGREVALILSKDGNPELYVMSIGGGGLTRLTNTRRAGEASPSWSPDGSRIVYVSDQSGSPQLYMVSRSGGEPRRLTSRGSQNVAPDWGANNIIAFASLFGGRWNICVMDPDNLQVKQITNGDADYEDPSWAPDGRHLASGRGLRYQSKVYLLDTMGDAPIALTDYPGDWYSPAWAPGR